MKVYPENFRRRLSKRCARMQTRIWVKKQDWYLCFVQPNPESTRVKLRSERDAKYQSSLFNKDYS